MTITFERRQVLYNKMFQFMIDNGISSVSVNVNALCDKLGVELVPLSKIVDELKLSEHDIFSIWGNSDGAIQRYGNTHRISYNDNAREGRARFTICEEIAHMVYGHTSMPEFCMFNQNYSEEIYKQCDEEARIGAGFLMCHPKFFYYYEDIVCPDLLAQVCHITQKCAETRYDVLNRFKEEIISNSFYPLLPEPSISVRTALLA